MPEEIERLYKEHPKLQVLTITIDTGDIKIDWIGRQERKMKVTTVEGLAETLRTGQLSQLDRRKGKISQN